MIGRGEIWVVCGRVFGCGCSTAGLVPVVTMARFAARAYFLVEKSFDSSIHHKK